MTARTRMWHWSDLVGALGIILLLFGAPAIAQAAEDDSRLGGGRTFTTPYPHVGDHIEYDLVLDDKRGNPRVLKSVLTVDRYAVEPGEVPVDVAFAERRVYASVDIQETNLTIRIPPFQSVDYFDEHGWRVYQLYEGFRFTSESGDGVAWMRHEGHPESPFVHDQFGLRATFAYTPSTRLIVQEFVNGAYIEATSEGTRPTVVYHKLEYLGEPFFASRYGTLSPEPAFFNWLFGGSDSEPEECVAGSAHRWFDLLAGFAVIRWDIGGPECTASMSHVFAPGHAGAAGFHEDRVRGGEIVASVDFVPGTLRPGTGAPIPVRQAQEWVLDKPKVPPPPVLRALPRIALGAMDGSDVPLVRDVTFSTLRDLLSSGDTPTGVHETLANGAKITAFAWKPFPASADDNETTPGESYRSRWTVSLTEPGGITMEVSFWLEERYPGPALVVENMHLCHDSRGSGCPSRVDPGVLDAPVADPAAILSLLRGGDPTDSWAEGHDVLVFEYGPAPRLSADAAPQRLVHRYNLFHLAHQPNWIEPYTNFYKEPSTGFAFWEFDREREAGTLGAVSISDGRVWRQTAWAPGEPDDHPIALEPAADQVSLIREPTAVPALLGIFLIISAAVARLWAALAAGVHFPVVTWLYAKVRHADVLLSDRRAAIMAAIEAERGLTASDVASRFGFGWGSTVHHLQRLVQAGLLRTAVDGRRRYYVPIDQDVSVVSRSISHQRLLAAIEANPGATAAELADEVKRRRASVTRLAARLVDAELVTRKRDGRKVRFYPAPSEESTEPEQSF